MHEDRPSKTAFRVALRRAAARLLDEPRVFEDPLALAIVGAESEELAVRPRTGARCPGFCGRSWWYGAGMPRTLARTVESGTQLRCGPGGRPRRCVPESPSWIARLQVDHPATQGEATAPGSGGDFDPGVDDVGAGRFREPRWPTGSRGQDFRGIRRRSSPGSASFPT